MLGTRLFLRTLSAAAILGLAACGPAAAPTEHVIVITASPTATDPAIKVPTAAASATAAPTTRTHAPASPQTATAVLSTATPPAATDLPICSDATVGDCRLAPATATPLVLPPTATLEPPLATLAPAATQAPPTSPPTATAPPARAADAPTITETTLSIDTYGWRDHLVDTQPGDAIYPYPRIDYDPFTFDPGAPQPQTYKAVVLENAYVRLTFLPELGGRLYQWYDKITGRPLLYNNPVIKATAFGVRGWWLSLGGLEWGLPLPDHGLMEWVPWSYTSVTTPTTAAVVLSAVDDRTGLECAIRVELDNRHAYFSLRPVLHNPTAAPISYQFWMSAISTPGGDNRSGPDLRFNVPVTRMAIHSTDDKTLPSAGQTISWPLYNGRDMSLYGNWTKYLSMFASPGAIQPYVGLYTFRSDGGFIRVFPPEVARGLKLFAPGDLPAFVWTTNNGDSSYVELWGGLTSNFSENAVLAADDQVTWTEYWYPFHGIGNYSWASRDAALTVDDTATDITVRLYLTAAESINVTVYAGGARVAQWAASASAPGPWQNTWSRTVNGAAGVALTDSAGNLLARYGAVPGN